MHNNTITIEIEGTIPKQNLNTIYKIEFNTHTYSIKVNVCY